MVWIRIRVRVRVRVSLGPRSNFEIGWWGGTISAPILGGGGGTRHFFLLTLYNVSISCVSEIKTLSSSWKRQ